jgi:NDP-sugar pyrophosphorylase family protein
MRVITQCQQIHGIVLAGVQSWGESVLEQVCSRPLLPVAGRPLIWYVLEWLRDCSVPRATICANSDTRAFSRCIGGGDRLGMRLDYYEDIMPRGPAGCMRDAAALSDADTFVVVDGTIVTQIDLDAIVQAHRNLGVDLTVAVSGIGQTNGMAATGLEPLGIYVVSRQALDFVSQRGYQDIKEMLIPGLHREGRRVVPYIVPEGSSLRITGVASYLAVNGWVAEQTVLHGEPPMGYGRCGDACVHDSAEVASTACLAGPVVVGPECMIGENATIVGPTVIGADSRIGDDVVIRQAAIWSRCSIGAGAILDRSIMLDGAAVAPGEVVRDTVCQPVHNHSRATRAGGCGSYWALVPPDAAPADNNGRMAGVSDQVEYVRP